MNNFIVAAVCDRNIYIGNQGPGRGPDTPSRLKFVWKKIKTLPKIENVLEKNPDPPHPLSGYTPVFRISRAPLSVKGEKAAILFV